MGWLVSNPRRPGSLFAFTVPGKAREQVDFVPKEKFKRWWAKQLSQDSAVTKLFLRFLIHERNWRKFESLSLKRKSIGRKHWALNVSGAGPSILLIKFWFFALTGTMPQIDHCGMAGRQFWSVDHSLFPVEKPGTQNQEQWFLLKSNLSFQLILSNCSFFFKLCGSFHVWRLKT